MSQSIVICADGGLQHAQVGHHAHLVEGTSIHPREMWRPGAENTREFLRFPVERIKPMASWQSTALAEALPIYHGGSVGNRLDHSLANLDLLRLAREGINPHWKCPPDDPYGQARPYVRSGEDSSLIPLSERCDGVTTKGLYYPCATLPCTRAQPWASVIKLSQKA